MRSRCDHCGSRRKLSEAKQADSTLNAAYITTLCPDPACRAEADEVIRLTRRADSTGHPPALVMTGHDTAWPWPL